MAKTYKQERIESLMNTTNEMMTELKTRIGKGELSANQIMRAMEYLNDLNVEIKLLIVVDYFNHKDLMEQFDARTCELITMFGEIVNVYHPRYIRKGEISK